MEKDIEQILKEHKEETKRHFDVKTEETKRHFDVVAGDLKGQIQSVAEQVAVNTEKITNLEGGVKKIGDDVKIIKTDIEFIKNELKQKVSIDEFAALERRVGILENKFNR